jgi:hypothetical protein
MPTTKPTIRVHDIETGEVIDREMTDVEFAEYQADQAATQAAATEAAAKTAAKQAVIDKLGLTAEEIAALLG